MYPVFTVRSCRLLSYCACVIAPCSRKLFCFYYTIILYFTATLIFLVFSTKFSILNRWKLPKITKVSNRLVSRFFNHDCTCIGFDQCFSSCLIQIQNGDSKQLFDCRLLVGRCQSCFGIGTSNSISSQTMILLELDGCIFVSVPKSPSASYLGKE